MKASGAAATTILVPRLAESKYRFQDDPRLFYSADLGIKILSPDGWAITDGSERGAGTHSVSILLNKETLFHPRINLMIEDVGDVNFMDYFFLQLNSLSKRGTHVLRSHLDENSQIITLLLLQTTDRSARLFGLQKHFLRRDRVYSVVVSDLKPEYIEKEPRLVHHITRVIKSFTFIEFSF